MRWHGETRLHAWGDPARQYTLSSRVMDVIVRRGIKLRMKGTKVRKEVDVHIKKVDVCKLTVGVIDSVTYEGSGGILSYTCPQRKGQGGRALFGARMLL